MRWLNRTNVISLSAATHAVAMLSAERRGGGRPPSLFGRSDHLTLNLHLPLLPPCCLPSLRSAMPHPIADDLYVYDLMLQSNDDLVRTIQATMHEHLLGHWYEASDRVRCRDASFLNLIVFHQLI